MWEEVRRVVRQTGKESGRTGCGSAAPQPETTPRRSTNTRSHSLSPLRHHKALGTLNALAIPWTPPPCHPRHSLLVHPMHAWTKRERRWSACSQHSEAPPPSLWSHFSSSPHQLVRSIQSSLISSSSSLVPPPGLRAYVVGLRALYPRHQVRGSRPSSRKR